MTPVPRMLDVDYLLALHGGTAPPLGRALVYRYRSGVLIPRLRAALQADPERHRTPLVAGALPLREGFGSGGLIDTLRVFDWPVRAGGGLDDAALDASVVQLATAGSVASIHLVPHDSAVTERRAWRTVERTCFLVEEPLVTAVSLEPILRYLAATSDLRPAADLLAQPGFVGSFTDLVTARAELPVILQAFDERLLVGMDPATNQFDPERYRRDAVRRSGRQAPLRHLRDLVAHRDARDLVDLVCAFDERRFERGGTAFALVTTLYAISRKLLEPPLERTRKRASPHLCPTAANLQQAVLWAVLVLAWEDSLSRSVREETDGYRRGPDLLVPSISGLGRDFLARASWPDSRDLLTDRWAGIRRAVARFAAGAAEDRLSTVRDLLVRDLAAALARHPDGIPTWLARLRDAVRAASVSIESPDGRTGQGAAAQAPMEDAVCPPPMTFAAVMGRQHAVTALIRHARDRKDGVDLLLYGPAGVGKRTLARLYAQVLLCGEPASGQAPGGILDGHPGYIEVDGTHAAIEAHTRAIVETIGATSLFTERTVIVVRHADRYPSGAFDHLLKPMEDNPRVCFALLAQDPDGVRTAGRSRCFDYRVRPLDRPEALALARQILRARGVTCDDAELALIVDISAGVPERLHETCRRVADVTPMSRGMIRSRLGLDWVEVLIERMPEILTGAPDTVLAGLMKASEVRSAELEQRVRAVLQYAYLRDAPPRPLTPAALNPALRFLAEDASARPATAISSPAPSGALTTRHTLASLISAWMSDRLL